MSPKNLLISSTATSSTTGDWRPVDSLPPAKHRGTSFELEPNAILVSERRQVSEAAGKITVSIEPASFSRRQAIRRLNEEIEGRSSPSDTYASKTAG
jgi:hypothetical protein